MSMIQLERKQGFLHGAVTNGGSFSIESTTLAVGNFVMKNPRATISVDTNVVVFVTCEVAIASGTVADHVYAQLMASSDSGTTWSPIGQPIPVYPAGTLQYNSVSLATTHVPATTGEIVYGISIGNPPGSPSSNVVYALTYRSITAIAMMA